MKCSNRCAVKMLTEQCNVLDNGKDVGSTVKSLIEKILVAQRIDLERMNDVQCDKDELALRVIDEVKKSEQSRRTEETRINNNKKIPRSKSSIWQSPRSKSNCSRNKCICWTSKSKI
uniref:Uncharacterized protein n=1 Tax=Ditylenchus dipsaci TaxID=166011 RepID=A0A915DIH4_9BILA